VVQTAAKLVLEPIFEAGFEDNAYGYRPVRGAVDAVKEVHRLICRGHTDVEVSLRYGGGAQANRRQSLFPPQDQAAPRLRVGPEHREFRHRFRPDRFGPDRFGPDHFGRMLATTNRL
jgi:hypothetical protein